MQKREKRTTPLPTYIFGRHAVQAALQNKPEAVTRLLCTRRRVRDAVMERARSHNIAIADFDPATPPRGLPEEAVHQGFVAEIAPEKLTVSYQAFISDYRVTNDTALVMLAELTDPQNVGAIIRSSAALGAAGVFVPEHRQAQISGTVVKVSAGAAFSIPLISVGNVNMVLRDLKERGCWVYGLAGDGDVSLPDEDFRKPSVFVVGGESDGLREKTREECDITVRIPLHERVESLNAATALSIALYAWSVRRSSRS